MNKQNKPGSALVVIFILCCFLFGIPFLKYGIIFLSVLFLLLIAIIILIIVLNSKESQKKVEVQPSKNPYSIKPIKLEEPIKEDKPFCDIENEELRQYLQENYDLAQKIKTFNDKIQDELLSEKLDFIQNTSIDILQAIAKDKDKKKNARMYFSYHLPTLIKQLQNYVSVIDTSANGENIRSIKENVEKMIDEMKKTSSIVLDNLYNKEALDIKTDLVVSNNLANAENKTLTS